MAIMVGKKALVNRAFLIDAWHNSINKQNDLQRTGKSSMTPQKLSYAHINDGADFTCSTHDLAFAIRDLKGVLQ